MKSTLQNLLVCKNQHKDIMDRIQSILSIHREETRKLPSTVSSELNQLFLLYLHHIKSEEEYILPILQDIFPTQKELSEYLQQEHQRICLEIQLMIDHWESHSQCHVLVYDCLNEMFSHTHEEEDLLYPLIQQHLTNDTHQSIK
ncbi:MAG TPA: hemerythrin domain-containing protein [Bacillota bacterium]|nr:hemerythrin domain-containing protein [Bacillota bacterium]